MNADTIKAAFTYLIAFTVVVGGFAVIYFTKSESSAAEIRLLIGGFIGSALTFVFVQENSTRASRSAERQFAQGSASSVPPLDPPKPEK
jgi:hypothetical protein